MHCVVSVFHTGEIWQSAKNYDNQSCETTTTRMSKVGYTGNKSGRMKSTTCSPAPDFLYKYEFWGACKIKQQPLENNQKKKGSDGEKDTNVLTSQSIQVELTIWQKHDCWT